jgi:predicted PhzF superfamily epimerase YddE/YHI9
LNVDVEVDVVRVFTTDAGELGNKLGVVLSSAASQGREQAIAAAVGFSETVFIDDVDAGVARIRIFTPAAELPFAGHPSVGTAWWLRERGTPVHLLSERAGDVAVRYDGDLTWITGRAEWASEFTWFAVETPEDVDAVNPTAFTDGHNYVYAWIDEDAGALRSRMFAPVLGIVEDEATGAAAVAVTARLGRDLSITQGLGSRILTHQLADGFIEVGGCTVSADPIRL